MDPLSLGQHPQLQMFLAYWTIFTTAVVGACSWLKQVLWSPSEINRVWYTRMYELIERIGMTKRKQWAYTSSQPKP